MPGKKRNAEKAVQEEESFPRGGGSGLAPIVHKQLKEVRYMECILAHKKSHRDSIFAAMSTSESKSTSHHMHVLLRTPVFDVNRMPTTRQRLSYLVAAVRSTEKSAARMFTEAAATTKAAMKKTPFSAALQPRIKSLNMWNCSNSRYD